MDTELMILRQLFESNETVGLIFGRFNPPHKGHKAAWEMMAKNNAWYVGTNKSTQGPKDPLPYDVKIKAMETIWPEVAKHIVPHQSWLTLASEIYKKHGSVTLNVYTDEAWVIKALNQYNGVKKPDGHGFYDFKDIVSVQTPRLSSATALRKAVADDDRDAFADAAGVPADTPVAGTPFFDLVAQHLGQYKKESAVAETPKDEVIAKIVPKQKERMIDKVLKYLDAKINSDTDKKKTIDSHAFDIGQEVRLDQIGLTPRTLAKAYKQATGIPASTYENEVEEGMPPAGTKVTVAVKDKTIGTFDLPPDAEPHHVNIMLKKMAKMIPLPELERISISRKIASGKAANWQGVDFQPQSSRPKGMT